MILALLLACSPPDDSGEAPLGGALGLGRQNPFPSMELVGEDGRLDLQAGDLPVAPGGADWDFAPFAARSGFSVVQPSVVRFPVEIDASSIGGEADMRTDGPVRMVDLDSGEALLCFSELDAAPDRPAGEPAALIVRPMRTLTPGHRVAVVVTHAVTSGGAPVEVPAAEGHYADLQAELAALGQDDVLVAWDFPVASGTALLDNALAATSATPTAHTFTRTWEADSDDPPPEGWWRLAEGSFTTTGLLVDGTHLDLSADRTPTVQGPREAYLMVGVPESARDAAPGTVPVVVFGHGLLSSPGDYLDNAGDPNGVVAVANQLGAIVVATKWTGLSKDDLVHALDVAGDFSRFDEIPQMLVQGVSDTVALLHATRDGELLDDPLFGGLADRGHIYYYGISLGGIEGAVTVANQDVAPRAVLHVGGAAWATMLERSADWPAFDTVVTRAFPDPWDRQVLYAASQVLWDPVDPASYVDKLAAGPWLWQESIGDEQVPNLTTELLLRSVGFPLGTPNVTAPVALPTAPLPITDGAVVQMDPEEPLPDPVNRPAFRTGAHSEPRLYPGVQQQTVHFLLTGEVAQTCGDAPCSASNPGSL